MYLCEFLLNTQIHIHAGPASSAWYPWQPQWNVVKVVMSMLRLTDRQTDRELALGQGYKAANNYAACSCVCAVSFVLSA